MDKEILLKYLKNNCSDKEFEELVAWLEQGVLSGNIKDLSYNQWQLLEPELKNRDAKKYNALLNKIHHEINLRENEKKESKVVSLGKVTKWLTRAAAVFFIPLLGVVFYLLSERNIHLYQTAELAVDSIEIIAPIGSRTVVQLSDGTEVNLNYGSRIKYPRDFVGDIRGVTLTGEGYFDVARNPEKPFIVKAGRLNVKALGTEFNVNAYPDDNVIATTLVEGKVEIEKVLSGSGVERLGAMLPGQHVAYDTETDRVMSTTGNIDEYISWKEGKLVFDNTPIIDVTEKLGRMFNVDIQVAEEVRDLTYTVTFTDDPLFLILDLMTETTPITYTRLPRKKLPDGTFTKQKIWIDKRK
ncbi:FecR family protein [Mariniphaga anaerophila]|uniref:FecR family protein n=1 Tax=Mariniphaga anaerophila TaxID=1484053 RepID=A0A1M5FHW5_9BACT|nr:FecR domain-containing protein [Mariniphaga anaerophila]SHF90721.1 FecR family protein [Mariniphaga anaerophila]